MDSPKLPLFLTAEWRRLVNLTYAIDPDLLKEHLPEGVEADIYKGKAHISLVAFEFLNTRVKGLKLPFHVNFPEINLRYYARYGEYLGVGFIKELVPKFCISFIARKLYNEPYYSFPMTLETEIADHISVLHTVKKAGKSHTISAKATNTALQPGPETPDYYFKEHDLGFGTDLKGRGVFYRVDHSVWDTYPLVDFNLQFDFGAIYGPKWAFLNDATPRYSVMAEGSPVSVSHPRKLKDFESFRSMFHAPFARY